MAADVISGNHVYVNLSKANDSEDSLVMISQELARNLTVEHLDLSSNQLKLHDIENLSRSLLNCTNLKRLNLRFNETTNEGVPLIIKVIENNPQLEVVDLKSNSLSDEGAKLLSPYLAQLKRLSLRYVS
jgi:Ran GTPase-activating protein (RanGAP) involved in mRNA processing and transport